MRRIFGFAATFILLGGLAHPVAAQEVSLGLNVGAFEPVDSLIAVQVMVSVAEAAATPLLLSATLEVDYDDDEFKYRAANSGDLRAFLTSWIEGCTERTGRSSDCLTMLPYHVSHNNVNTHADAGRVRTDIYLSLGYDANMGEAGVNFGLDTVAIALYIFEYIGGDPGNPGDAGEQASAAGIRIDHHDQSFSINRRSATISLFGGRDERGGIGEYVDCLEKSETCAVRFVE